MDKITAHLKKPVTKLRELPSGIENLTEEFDYKNHRHLFITVLIIILAVSSNLLVLLILQPFTKVEVDANKNLEQFSQPKKPQEIKYISDEILVKFKDPRVGEKLKSPLELKKSVGFSKIDQEIGIKSMEKVFVGKKNKTANIRKSSFNENVLSGWYKVKLNLPSKVIVEEQTGLMDSEWGKNQQDETVEEHSTKVKSLKSLINVLKSNPDVEAVELNNVYSIQQAISPSPALYPNDPYYWSKGTWGNAYDDLWGLKTVKASEAWKSTTGSDSIVVASIDTGVDINHPDIQSNIWNNPGEIKGNNIDDDGNGYIDDINGWNFIANSNNSIDDHGHGTHTSGTILASGNNSLGIAGVAWKGRIMPLKFLGNDGSGSSSNAALAIQYAVNNGAQITNNSWGGGGKNRIVTEAFLYAASADVIMIASAGNFNEDTFFTTPANEPNAIAVAAFDANNQKASFSNYGTKIDVAAPGVDVLSLKASTSPMCTSAKIVGTNYCRVSGTSMSGPHVAGAAVLIRAKNPNLTANEVRRILRASATDVSTPGYDLYSGAGMLNVGNALKISTPPVVEIASPLEGSNVTQLGTVFVFGKAYGSGFSEYELAYGNGEIPSSWSVISKSSTSVNNSSLGSFSPTNLGTGLYTIKLSIKNTDGFVFTEFRRFVIEKDLVQGFPKEFKAPTKDSGELFSDVTVGDLDGDSFEEVIATSWIGNFGTVEVSGKVMAFKKDGSQLAGWPVKVGNAGYLSSVNVYSPRLVDLDNDGNKEVAVIVKETSSGNWLFKLYVFEKNGTIKAGWPVDLFGPRGNMLITDLNGDSKKEITVFDVKSSISQLVVLNANGSVLSKFQTQAYGMHLDFPNPFAVDIGNDGKDEIIYSYFVKGGDMTAIGVVNPISGESKNITTSSTYLRSAVAEKDGRKYLVVLSSYPSNLSVYELSTLNLHFRKDLIGTEDGIVTAADANGDGQQDIILNYATTIPRTEVYSLDGSFMGDLSTETYPHYNYIVFGDFDGNKKVDELWMGRSSDGIKIFDHDKNVLWERNALDYRYWKNSYFDSFRLMTDLDKDGKPEVLTTYRDFKITDNTYGLLLFENNSFTTSRSSLDWIASSRDYIDSRSVGSIAKNMTPSPSPSPSPAPQPTLQPTPTPTPAPISCSKMDMDNSNDIDLTDVLIILDKFGSQDPKYDVNSDGTVDMTDALIVKEAFGRSCN